jgi:hypothetical protein
MRPSKLLLSAAALVIAALPFTLPTPALADTFQFFNLGNANNHNIFGIDTSGAAVIVTPDPAPGGNLLYQTYVGGVLINSSTTIPNLIYDNGTACTPTVAAPVTSTPGLGKTRCNNGHEVYFGTFPTPSPNLEMSGIYAGPNLTDHLTDPSAIDSTLDQVVMNGSGDFAWVDGRNETIFEAVNQSIPEPGTLLLLATGSLTLIGTIRRRLN